VEDIRRLGGISKTYFLNAGKNPGQHWHIYGTNYHNNPTPYLGKLRQR